MTIYTGMTPEAREMFISWLERVLRHPENAERHADAINAQHDWSASLSVEIRGFFTATGNPETYSFFPDEMITEDFAVHD